MDTLRQTAVFAERTSFLQVELSPEEEMLFDCITALLQRLPMEGELDTDLATALTELTQQAQQSLRAHPSFTAENLLQLCDYLCQQARSHPELQSSLFPYVESALAVLLFMKEGVEQDKVWWVSKRGHNRYSLAKLATAMTHLKELLPE